MGHFFNGTNSKQHKAAGKEGHCLGLDWRECLSAFHTQLTDVLVGPNEAASRSDKAEGWLGS